MNGDYMTEKDWLDSPIEKRALYSFRIMNKTYLRVNEMEKQIRTFRGWRFAVNSTLNFAGAVVGGFVAILALCKLGVMPG